MINSGWKNALNTCINIKKQQLYLKETKGRTSFFQICRFQNLPKFDIGSDTYSDLSIDNIKNVQIIFVLTL